VEAFDTNSASYQGDVSYDIAVTVVYWDYELDESVDNGPVYGYGSATYKAPATASIDAADIVNDQIIVTLSGDWGAGLLRLTAQIGAFGYDVVYQDGMSAGNYTFSWNRDSLPGGEYTNLHAVWTPGSQVASADRPTNFFNM
jgi:hypothetical protein